MQGHNPESFFVASAIVAMAMATQAAMAGPPFLTDDPVPVDYRASEFYFFSTVDKTSDGKKVAIPAFEYNYGVIPNTQLHLVVPFTHSAPNGSSSEYGIGDVEVGVKYRFIEETETLPQVAVFPMAELATGESSKGLGNGETWWRLPIWLQKSVGDWTIAYLGLWWGFGGAGNDENKAGLVHGPHALVHGATLVLDARLDARSPFACRRRLSTCSF